MDAESAQATPAALDRRLRSILPGARLKVQPLPDCPRLRLLLLDQAGHARRLDEDTVRRAMDNPLYWLFCWASGQVLARYLLDHPQTVSGRRVLDFGCGSGVVAIAAKLAGAREVIACDNDALALRATAYNARLNRVSLQLAEDFEAVGEALDIILVADVLYDRANLGWLTRFAERAPEVLLADSRVRNFAVPPYVRIALEESCTVPDLDESREFSRVAIYRAACYRED
jgi:predicted nicotinamide N-methyase